MSPASGLLLALLCASVTAQPPMIEIAFSFDTTGSMYPVLEQVREVVADMIDRLQSDIPGIRLAVFAHGDYMDASSTYDAVHVDFTTDTDALQDFVRNSERTGGGDLPEAYELVLRQVHTQLSWSPTSQASVVLIGDDRPHELGENPLGIDWRQEADILNEMGIRVYAIRALANDGAEYFYEELANRTGGYYLRLERFDSIFDFIMAISYREYGLEFLEAYEDEVRSRPGGITDELAALFKTLKENPSGPRPTRGPPPVTSHPLSTTPAPPQTPPPITYNKNMQIYSLHIQSEIAYRMATTTIWSKLANRGDNSTEATFAVTLPKAAFISNFSMEIDGVDYAGEVKEKEAARKQYEAAKKRGESAGHVVQAPRNTNKFNVKVNIAAGSKVTFELTYQEVLERRLGIYEHVVHIDPGQIVQDFRVEVNIRESRDLTQVHVPPLRNDLLNQISEDDANTLAEIIRLGPNAADIVFTPSERDQREASEQGVRGQFVVQYDVERPEKAGELMVVDGYFLHFIAPEGLEPADKDIMFVLDTSGSMSGRKLQQLKDAMAVILDQLRPGDNFNIIGFSSFFRRWQEEGLVPASPENVAAAKAWVWDMFAAGGTDINAAVLEGIQKLVNRSDTGEVVAPMVVFLTDGKPTRGVTNKKDILKNIEEQNDDSSTVFALGFGSAQDIDFPLLQQMSLQNGGFSRRIYEDSDADLQLQGFFNEIASPVMAQMKVSYLNDAVNETSLTTTERRTFFEGTELIVAGKLNDVTMTQMEAQILANTIEGPVDYKAQSDEPEEDIGLPSGASRSDYFERLWAYLTIKEILDRRERSTNGTEKDDLKEQALEMSLKYHFVTPVTSMVVTKPEEEPEGEALKGDGTEEGEAEPIPGTVKPPGSRPDGIYHSHSSVPAPSRDTSHYTAHKSHYGGYADNDPHFMVRLAGSDVPICFDVMGTPGDIFQLIYDPNRGITVNGLIVAKNDSTTVEAKDQKTYFGQLSILHGRTKAVLTPFGIHIQNKPYRWTTNRTYHQGGVQVKMLNRNRARVSVGSGIVVTVIRHKVAPGTDKVDFLGVYIEEGEGFSADVHGLLGQFQQLRVHVNRNAQEPQEQWKRVTGDLRFPDMPRRPHVKVYEGGRRNMATKRFEKCWFVRHNGHKLLDGKIQNYRVPQLMFTQLAPGLKKHFML